MFFRPDGLEASTVAPGPGRVLAHGRMDRSNELSSVLEGVPQSSAKPHVGVHD